MSERIAAVAGVPAALHRGTVESVLDAVKILRIYCREFGVRGLPVPDVIGA